ncbi:hypothetical protein PM082_016682 [Marasmius tenuissimus]|nr:hypothetical protein PM082_016682 [Marasmius tenuissimus]
MESVFSVQAQPPSASVLNHKPARSIKNIIKYPWVTGMFCDPGETLYKRLLPQQLQEATQEALNQVDHYLSRNLPEGEQVFDFTQGIMNQTGTGHATVINLAFSLIFLDMAPLIIGSPCALPVPRCVPRTKVIGQETLALRAYKVVNEWPKLFQDAAKALEEYDSVHETPASPPADDSLTSHRQVSGMMRCIHLLSNIRKKSSKLLIDTIALNIYLCALHLHWLLLGHADLPQTSNLFRAKFLEELSSSDVPPDEKFFMLKNLRSALQTALAISPFVLFTNLINFATITKPQTLSLLQIWFHLGNQRPAVLREVEMIVWREIIAVDGVTRTAIDALRVILVKVDPFLKNLDSASSGTPSYSPNDPIWPLI